MKLFLFAQTYQKVINIGDSQLEQKFDYGTRYQIIIVDYLLLCFNFSIQSKIRIRIKFKRIIHRVIFASDIDFVRGQGEHISEELVKQH